MATENGSIRTATPISQVQCEASLYTVVLRKTLDTYPVGLYEHYLYSHSLFANLVPCASSNRHKKMDLRLWDTSTKLSVLHLPPTMAQSYRSVPISTALISILFKAMLKPSLEWSDNRDLCFAV